MGNKKTQGVTSETVNPVTEEVEVEVEAHAEFAAWIATQPCGYADSVTVYVKKGDDGQDSRASFSAGVFKCPTSGMLALFVDPATVSQGYGVMGSKKAVIAAPATEWFVVDPEIEKKALEVKEVASNLKAMDELMAKAHITQWCAAHLDDERAMALFKVVSGAVTRLKVADGKYAKKGERLAVARSLFGSNVNAEPSAKLWKRIDEIIEDIKRAN